MEEPVKSVKRRPTCAGSAPDSSLSQHAVGHREAMAVPEAAVGKDGLTTVTQLEHLLS